METRVTEWLDEVSLIKTRVVLKSEEKKIKEQFNKGLIKTRVVLKYGNDKNRLTNKHCLIKTRVVLKLYC